MDACTHKWTAIDHRYSQCVKCGEIEALPDPKDKRIRELEAESMKWAKLVSELREELNDQDAEIKQLKEALEGE